MSNYDKAIEILMSGVDKDMATLIVKQLCPSFFGLQNDKKILEEHGHTRCDLCWGKNIE